MCCSLSSPPAPARRRRRARRRLPPPGGSTGTAAPATRRRCVDPAQAARLQRVMLPAPPGHGPPGAARPGQGGHRGGSADQRRQRRRWPVLRDDRTPDKANDDQLRAVLAHELAHQDLNHVAKAQVLGAGLNIGAAILNQIFPAQRRDRAAGGRARGPQVQPGRGVRGRPARRRAAAPRRLSERDDDRYAHLAHADVGAGQRRFFATHPGTGDRIEAAARCSSGQCRAARYRGLTGRRRLSWEGPGCRGSARWGRRRPWERTCLSLLERRRLRCSVGQSSSSPCRACLTG